MKTLLWPLLAVIFLCEPAFGQGAVVFNNRVGTQVDAPVSRPDGSGAGEGFTAQLILVHESGAITALFPRTTFRTSPPAATYYLKGVDVIVPGVAPGNTATFRMRAWSGDSFETSLLRGESANFTITVGGGTLPPSNLIGLQGFTFISKPTPPVWQFEPPTLQPNGELRIGANGQGATDIVLEATSDFRVWTPVATNKPSAGQTSFSIPIAKSAGGTFFRLALY